ncbi:DNA repair protein XRCC2 [Gadus chalcogrammus]|uniref:DNA repair protein XRCC2 n=1 Tax=Gadus chalcogrammus TaxID=1042646 RepID=UPI0024C4BAF3|nr:DNA repair protein XRCC2 [Gadus chalcogrammus]
MGDYKTETGAQLFARLEARRCLIDIEPHLFPKNCGPQYGEVVELHGLEGTGKTELLYHLLCRCILPVEAGGMGVEVVFVDTDYSLDMLRLVTILENRLAAGRSSSSPEAESDVGCSDEAALRTCLSRLLVVHCGSSSQLLLTLHYLETSLSSRPGLSLLLIDSISAFYWLDRCGGGESAARQEDKLTKCSKLLSRLLRDYRITVFATSHAIRRNYRNIATSSSSSSSSPSCSEYEQPYLCRPWQRLVTHRLLCSRGTPGTNMATACTEEQSRRQAFNVRCVSFSSSSSSSSKVTKAHKSSSFYVTDGGVVFV